MVPTIFVVRHGATALNAPEEERIRAWNPKIELTEDATKVVAKTALVLRKVPVHYVLSSDLLRARQTADIISRACGTETQISFELRPWDLGRLSGELVKFAVPALQFFMAHPNLEVPEGESFISFFRRWQKAFIEQIYYAEHHPEKATILVSHSRNLCAMPKILDPTLPFSAIKPITDVVPGHFEAYQLRNNKWQALKRLT